MDSKEEDEAGDGLDEDVKEREDKEERKDKELCVGRILLHATRGNILFYFASMSIRKIVLLNKVGFYV